MLRRRLNDQQRERPAGELVEDLGQRDMEVGEDVLRCNRFSISLEGPEG